MWSFQGCQSRWIFFFIPQHYLPYSSISLGMQDIQENHIYINDGTQNENGLQLKVFSVSLALWFKLASVPWYSPLFLLPGILTLKTYRFLHCNQKRTTLLHWHSIPQVQLVLAGPFLYQDPAAYFCGAFNFSRTFMHRFVNLLKVFPGFFLSVSAGICSK